MFCNSKHKILKEWHSCQNSFARFPVPPSVDCFPELVCVSAGFRKLFWFQLLHSQKSQGYTKIRIHLIVDVYAVTLKYFCHRTCNWSFTCRGGRLWTRNLFCNRCCWNTVCWNTFDWWLWWNWLRSISLQSVLAENNPTCFRHNIILFSYNRSMQRLDCMKRTPFGGNLVGIVVHI